MIKRIGLLLSISLLTLTVQASGIPVVDVAANIKLVTEGIARAQEFKEKMDHAKEKLDHYKDMVDGHFNFEDFINDPSNNEFMVFDDWKDIYNEDNPEELQKLRDEFKMNSPDPATQQGYDRELKSYRTQEKFYQAAVERNRKMMDLLNQFNTATTPAAKADLANAIKYEQMQIENDQKMMATLDKLMAKQELMAHEAEVRASRKIIHNEGYPRRTQEEIVW